MTTRCWICGRKVAVRYVERQGRQVPTLPAHAMTESKGEGSSCPTSGHGLPYPREGKGR